MEMWTQGCSFSKFQVHVKQCAAQFPSLMKMKKNTAWRNDWWMANFSLYSFSMFWGLVVPFVLFFTPREVFSFLIRRCWISIFEDGSLFVEAVISPVLITEVKWFPVQEIERFLDHLGPGVSLEGAFWYGEHLFRIYWTGLDIGLTSLGLTQENHVVQHFLFPRY